ALGELKPCGCAKEEDQGGIERRMGYFKTGLPPAANTLRVDLGDNFKEPTRQGRLKAKILARAMRKMEYDAILLGEKDLVYGNRFLGGLPELPWVAANVHIDGLKILPFRIKTFADGLRVALAAVVDPALFYEGRHTATGPDDPKKALAKVLATLQAGEPVDLVVLLTHMDRDKALQFLDVDGIDIVINGHIRDAEHLVDMTPVRRGEKIFLQPGPRGQKVGELRVRLTGSKKTYTTRMVPLDSKITLDKGMTDLYTAYNEQVEALFFESLAAKRKKTPAVYATDRVCKTCHAKAHATWAASRHGRAYATLTRVHKAFDPECLICHTTGFNRPGGFLSEIDTPGLKNVQCEVCHGPRRDHARAPQGGFAAQARDACRQCHVRNHSPKFNFGTYWPKIAH
ncbi:MAG: multiheme c-type cytochrome, partial [Nitrospinaceae bacterium]